MSPTDELLESVDRSLAFSSLILLPYSNRAATAEALSWESSLDSPCALGLFPSNTGSSTNTSWKPAPRGGRGFSGLDDEDCLGFTLIAVEGCRLSPWLPVLVIFLNCRGPGWVSVGGEESPQLILEAAGCGVFHISSLVSPLIGGRYWVVSSSYDVPIVSRGLGGRMPRMWVDGSCSVITRRISSFVVADGMVRFGLGLHGASNWPGP